MRACQTRTRLRGHETGRIPDNPKLTWSGTMRIEMSAVTRFGMTVLFADPDEEMFAMEKLGCRHNFSRSSVDLPDADATSERSCISSLDFGRTRSSHQVHKHASCSEFERHLLTEARQSHTIRIGYRAEDTDHIEHGFRHGTTVDTAVRVLARTADGEVGVHHASHAKDYAGVVFADPRAVGEQNDVDVSDLRLGWSVRVRNKPTVCYKSSGDSRYLGSYIDV